MKTKAFWFLFLYPVVCFGLDHLIRVVRLSMATEFALFPHLVIVAMSSFIFMGISFGIFLYFAGQKAGVMALLFLLALGLYAWLYPLLPPQLSFGEVLYGFNSYTSLSGALLIILSVWKIFSRPSTRSKTVK
ncbi:MAG: hypothetical protein ACK4SN_04590 [Bellilinea sp.]